MTSGTLHSRNYANGVVTVLIATLFWSLSGLFIRTIPDANVWQITAWRGMTMSAALLAFLLVRYRGDTLRRFRTLDRGALFGTACFFGICAIRPSSTIAFRPFSFLIDFCTVAQFVSVPPSQRWFT